MNDLCADRSCPMAWTEHEPHDGRPSRTPSSETCADPDCDMAWVEHEAHPPVIDGEAGR